MVRRGLQNDPDIQVGRRGEDGRTDYHDETGACGSVEEGRIDQGLGAYYQSDWHVLLYGTHARAGECGVGVG